MSARPLIDAISEIAFSFDFSGPLLTGRAAMPSCDPSTDRILCLGPRGQCGARLPNRCGLRSGVARPLLVSACHVLHGLRAFLSADLPDYILLGRRHALVLGVRGAEFGRIQGLVVLLRFTGM